MVGRLKQTAFACKLSLGRLNPFLHSVGNKYLFRGFYSLCERLKGLSVCLFFRVHFWWNSPEAAEK